MGTLRRALLLLAALAAVGCRKQRETPQQPAPSASASSVATLPPLPLEKFIAARAVGSNIELAAITRDRSVILATLDGALQTLRRDVLATDVEATPSSEVSLVGEAMVLVVGKLGGAPGAYLLRRGAAPIAVSRDRCLVRDGVAWLVREGASARVRVVRDHGDVTSPAITMPAEGEAQLACGPDAVTLSTRDGEHLSVATMGLDALGAPPPLREIEREGDLDDELRERLVLPRKGGDLALLRVGDSSVSVREGKAYEKVLRGSAPLTLRDDADLVTVTAAPEPRGKIYLLVSEPTSGKGCADGDPPRRIVLHELASKDGAWSATSRPVIELPCGVEAIDAHLRGDAARATMWWTEPVDTKSCTHPGLTLSAIVTAASDRPGAQRAAILAEGVARVDDSRFVAVVRPGGCVPWSAPGNGALVLAPTAK